MIYKKTFAGVMYSSSVGVTIIALTMISTLVILAVANKVVHQCWDHDSEIQARVHLDQQAQQRAMLYFNFLPSENALPTLRPRVR